MLFVVYSWTWQKKKSLHRKFWRLRSEKKMLRSGEKMLRSGKVCLSKV